MVVNSTKITKHNIKNCADIECVHDDLPSLCIPTDTDRSNDYVTYEIR